MEELQPETSASDDAALSRQNAAAARRRVALAMFLHNPQAAADKFPDLIDSLQTFVRLSTNPFADLYDPAIAKSGSEQAFDEWNAARGWGKSGNGNS